MRGGYEGGADGWAPIPETSTSPYTGDRVSMGHGDKSKKCIWVNTVEPDLGPVIQTTEGSFVGTIPGLNQLFLLSFFISPEIS